MAYLRLESLQSQTSEYHAQKSFKPFLNLKKSSFTRTLALTALSSLNGGFKVVKATGHIVHYFDQSAADSISEHSPFIKQEGNISSRSQIDRKERRELTLRN